MKFSIVITTYNRLTLLKRAIDSALAQTMPCEVVVVDDCSSDGTQAYVQERCEALADAGDQRLVYHRNFENLGHSKSVNAGVEKATGDWIKPVDDDDYLAPNCIEVMAKAIAQRPQAVICSCQAAQVDADGVELSRSRQVGSAKSFYIPQEDIHYGMLLEMVPFGTPIQVAFQRSAFLKTGGWDSSLDANFDDIDSWIKIAQFGDAIFINECLGYRTIWAGAYNQKFSLQKRLDTNILIKEKIYPKINQKHQSYIPKLQDIQAYLKLHWSLVALKQGKLLSAVKLSFPASLSPAAWQLLWQRYRVASSLRSSATSKRLEKNILRFQECCHPLESI
ncbi:glycosyltransferase family 2 protein [Microcoleus sp. FACHB-SPT15]|uniref:glycosyltransferase family 2 protein n=1 Tax=Microcoleus sp. FACHB-SPT15 TaxID=2692830 RepID=UPI0017832520|nr:glycosyltransferase family 2 protein [Microcoleus sp. FACHB-SPT15]MBD1808967.1 glycosyltransferase family 2 protein [Microcoleus sp. FACHB-SPT15]